MFLKRLNCFYNYLLVKNKPDLAKDNNDINTCWSQVEEKRPRQGWKCDRETLRTCLWLDVAAPLLALTQTQKLRAPRFARDRFITVGLKAAGVHLQTFRGWLKTLANNAANTKYSQKREKFNGKSKTKKFKAASLLLKSFRFGVN